VFGLCFLGFSIYDLGLCYGLDVFKGKYFLGFLKVWGLRLKVFFLCCFRFRVYGFLGFRVYHFGFCRIFEWFLGFILGFLKV